MTRFKPCRTLCIVGTLSILGAAMGAYAQTRSQASNTSASNQVVLKVGNAQVTESDINFVLQSLTPQARQKVESEGRRSIGNQYVTLLVLSQAAQSDHLDSSPLFQKAMKQHREQLLASLEYQKLASRAVVTPAEVNAYFAAHRPEFQQARIREVAIRKAQPGQTGAGLSPQAAQARAETIRKALASGEDPGKVAQQYAIPQEVVVDTQTRTIQNDSSLPEFVKLAFQLKKGELSPIQDTPNAIVFFQVVDHPQITLQQVAPEIEDALRQQKVNAAVEGLKKQTAIWMDQGYFNSSTGMTSP